MTLDELCHLSHAGSRAKGWWDDDRNDGEMIALIHSELSEALEALRKPGPSEKIPEFTALEEEMADVLIRLGDYAEARGLRLTEAVQAKLAFNARRSHRHGNKKF